MKEASAKVLSTKSVILSEADAQHSRSRRTWPLLPESLSGDKSIITRGRLAAFSSKEPVIMSS